MYDDTVMVDKAYYNKLKEQTTWISVKNRLPERGVEVLVTDGIHYMVTWCEDTNDGVKWVDNYYTYVNVRFREVTHWRPLPEPPESEVQDGDK